MAALADLPGLAVRISRELAEAGIPHAVSGAVAMAAHGYVRATRDLDILVGASAIQLPRVFEIIRGQGFAGEDRELIEALRKRYVAALEAGPATVEILVPVLPYHRKVLERAVHRDVPGGSVPFVTARILRGCQPRILPAGRIQAQRTRGAPARVRGGVEGGASWPFPPPPTLAAGNKS